MVMYFLLHKMSEFEYLFVLTKLLSLVLFFLTQHAVRRMPHALTYFEILLKGALKNKVGREARVEDRFWTLIAIAMPSLGGQSTTAPSTHIPTKERLNK